MLSDKVSCNNGKDWWYIAGYEIEGEIIILIFIKTPKSMFSYGVSQYDKNSADTMFWGPGEDASIYKYLEWGWVLARWKADNKTYKRRR